MNPETSKQQEVGIIKMKKNIKKRRRIYTSKKKRNPKFKEKTRNWLDLSKDVMILIFLKVHVIEILDNAQSVCSYWRKIAKEPQLFRCIDMRRPWDHHQHCNFTPISNMALDAIDRSCGQLLEFSIEYFCNDDVLERIAHSCNSLRCLRLISCFRVSHDGFVDAVKKLPLLEELELCLCSFSEVSRVIKSVGRSCPRLKYFRLDHKVVRLSPSEVFVEFRPNDEAFAIAASMPHLRGLHLFGNHMYENGLNAILEKCVHLEYLDLRQCFNIDFDEDLEDKCKEIKTLRLPDDSIDDYEYDVTGRYSGSLGDEYLYD